MTRVCKCYACVWVYMCSKNIYIEHTHIIHLILLKDEAQAWRDEVIS